MRLFVAVVPPAPVLDVVASLPREAASGGRVRWTSREQWHVTLRFLGEVGDPAPVLAALGRVTWPPAEATLGGLTARFGRSILHVPVSGLEAWASAVPVGPRDDRPFVGHITLARGRDVRGLEGVPVPRASWPAGPTPVLVRSHLGGGGARYEILG